MTSFILPEADLEFIAECCASEMKLLQGAQLLVTGGSGFFGRWLLSALLYANHRQNLGLNISTLTRSRENFQANIKDLASCPALEIIEADIRHLPKLALKPTHVIHAATDTTAGSSPQAQRALFDSIVSGTQALLDLATEAGASHFLLTSSGGVYGRIPHGVTHVQEDCLLAPDPLQSGSAYGIGKRAAEYLAGLAARSSKMHVTIARGFAFVGPLLPLDAHFAIGNFMRDAMHGQDIIIKGDGSPLRSYLYAADLVIWLLKIMFHGTNGQAYNLGSDQPISMKELAHVVCSQINPQVQVRILGESSIVGVGSSYVPSIEKAKRELDLKVYTSITDGIKKTARWHQQS